MIVPTLYTPAMQSRGESMPEACPMAAIGTNRNKYIKKRSI